jgi:hypothetical protein
MYFDSLMQAVLTDHSRDKDKDATVVTTSTKEPPTSAKAPSPPAASTTTAPASSSTSTSSSGVTTPSEGVTPRVRYEEDKLAGYLWSIR